MLPRYGGFKMTKNELIRALAQNLDFTIKDTTEIVEMSVETIKELLIKGEDINYPNFGKFVTQVAKERTRVNPTTGEKVECPAHRVVKFKPSQSFKDLIAE